MIDHYLCLMMFPKMVKVFHVFPFPAELSGELEDDTCGMKGSIPIKKAGIRSSNLYIDIE